MIFACGFPNDNDDDNDDDDDDDDVDDDDDDEDDGETLSNLDFVPARPPPEPLKFLRKIA